MSRNMYKLIATHSEVVVYSFQVELIFTLTNHVNKARSSKQLQSRFCVPEILRKQIPMGCRHVSPSPFSSKRVCGLLIVTPSWVSSVLAPALLNQVFERFLPSSPYSKDSRKPCTKGSYSSRWLRHLLPVQRSTLGWSAPHGCAASPSCPEELPGAGVCENCKSRARKKRVEVEARLQRMIRVKRSSEVSV